MDGRGHERDEANVTERTSSDGNEGLFESRITRIVSFALAACFVAVACLVGLAYHELRGARVEVIRELEYAVESDDGLADLVECSNDRVNVAVTGNVDLTSVGVQEVPVRLSVGPLSRTEVVEVEVVDTKGPQIELVADSITIELGEDVTSASLVKEVTDPVDGRLSELEREPEPRKGEPGRADIYDKGFYVVEGIDSLNEVGTHDICVRATDSHGIVSEKHMEVVVTEPLEGAQE